MSGYTIEFKPKKGNSWKVFQAGDFKYENVDRLELNEVMPEIYKTYVPTGTKIRILKDGKVWKTFENGAEKITLRMPMIEEDEIESEMKKQRRRRKNEDRALGWD